jgi:iron(III) transport system permease protein
VYATEIYLATRSLPRLDAGLAGAFAMTLLVLSAAAVLLYYRLLGTSLRFATITGKAYRAARIDLGRWRYPLGAAALATLGVISLVPMLTIAWASLIPFLQLPSAESLATVSGANYARVLADPLVPRAFVNSVTLGAAAATIVTLLTSLIAFVTVRTRMRGRVLLDAMAFAPIALPGVVIALAVLWTYLVLRVPIYGTLWIILAAYITKYLPVAMRLASASMAQVHADLEDAGATSGAGWARVFRRILWPLVLPGVIASWAWVLVHAFREVSVGAMLYVQGTETLGVAVFSLANEGGNYPKVAALGVMIFGLLVLFAVAARIVAGRRSLLPR